MQLKQVVADRFPLLLVAWWRLGRLRSPEIELALLEGIVGPDDVTVDVGAYLGLYTRRLAKLSRKVYAFEPSRQVAEILRRTTPGKVVVHQTALSDSDGDAELRIPVDEGRLTPSLGSIEPAVTAGHNTIVQSVPRRRLDAVVREDVSFVKIDVEGHEMSVLRGASGLIERCRPVFLVEAEERHRPGATASLFGFFRDLNYDGFFVRGQDIVSADEFDVRVAQDQASLTAEGARRKDCQYINNFFFFPPEKNGRARLTRALH